MLGASYPVIGGGTVRIQDSLRQIERCRYPSGLYSAVPADSPSRLDIYSAVWIRDTIYTLMAFEAIGDLDRLRAGVHELLDRVLLRWSYKLDWRIVHGLPTEDYEYLHPRYGPVGQEIHSELWGLRQDDAIGLAIWALSRWHERFDVLRNDYQDFHLVQRLIWYCDAIDVPHVPDSGLWEEEEPTRAVHLSSIGAVGAALRRAARIGVKDIPERLTADTAARINLMAGRESSHHDTDMALLTLVWPLGEDVPIPQSEQREIVERVERELLGTRGVVRYTGDMYNACHGASPEWTMGLGFLALARNALGDRDRAIEYLRRFESVATEASELPESWCHDAGHDRRFNSPLCWSHALHVVASVQLGRRSLDQKAA
jgi:GH15 family glucan-1,4-alpha-glucosidase